MSTIGHPERTITADGPNKGGPNKGVRFPVTTPTTYMIVLRFRSGAIISLIMSFDIARRSRPPIEIHGTAGSMRLPDPDTYGGDVALARPRGEWDVMSTAGDALWCPELAVAARSERAIDHAN